MITVYLLCDQRQLYFLRRQYILQLHQQQHPKPYGRYMEGVLHKRMNTCDQWLGH